MTFGFNVMECGVKGDGITDDTAAIQDVIDRVAKRGGGKILFPYTPTGYRIGSPARETVNGRICRAQLVIPPGLSNIQLEGEMPCRMLYSYQVRPLDIEKKFTPTLFGTMPTMNTFLFSDWMPPEETDPAAHPWSILAAPEGDSCNGQFSVRQFSIANLEFRVALDQDKMYPTQSAVNLQHVSRINVQDSQFCLNENIGDAQLDKELQPNPCHTVGLMASGDQNDNNVLRNVAVQGFRYGLVLGEHVVADYLYAHNCEEALVFHDSSHLSVINHLCCQHNTCMLSTTREELFGHRKGPCNVLIGSINFEAGQKCKPVISRLQHAVYDPENRLYGSLCWYEPWGEKVFPVEGGANMRIERFRPAE